MPAPTVLSTRIAFYAIYAIASLARALSSCYRRPRPSPSSSSRLRAPCLPKTNAAPLGASLVCAQAAAAWRRRARAAAAARRRRARQQRRAAGYSKRRRLQSGDFGNVTATSGARVVFEWGFSSSAPFRQPMGPSAGTGRLRGAYATQSRGGAYRTRMHRGSRELAARGFLRSRLYDDGGIELNVLAPSSVNVLSVDVPHGVSACLSPALLTLSFSILGRKVLPPSDLVSAACALVQISVRRSKLFERGRARSRVGRGV